MTPASNASSQFSSCAGLNLNIIRPANLPADAKLPILFVSAPSAPSARPDVMMCSVDIRRCVRGRIECDVSPNSTATSIVADNRYRPLHNGTAIVQRSIDLGQPVIYVAVNYR